MALQPFPDNILSAESRHIRKRITSCLDNDDIDVFDVVVLITKLTKTASKLCHDYLCSSPGTLNPRIANFRIFAGKILGKQFFCGKTALLRWPRSRTQQNKHVRKAKKFWNIFLIPTYISTPKSSRRPWRLVNLSRLIKIFAPPLIKLFLKN